MKTLRELIDLANADHMRGTWGEFSRRYRCVILTLARGDRERFDVIRRRLIRAHCLGPKDKTGRRTAPPASRYFGREARELPIPHLALFAHGLVKSE